jgi:hypothetical protein
VELSLSHLQNGIFQLTDFLIKTSKRSPSTNQGIIYILGSFFKNSSAG